MKTMEETLLGMHLSIDNMTLVTQDGEHGKLVKQSLQNAMQNTVNSTVPWQQKPIKETLEGQDNLTHLLYQIFSLQKTYGNKAMEFESVDNFFQDCLEEYSFQEIKDAFKQYVKRNKDVPTPSDIIGIMEMEKEKRTIRTASDAERYNTLKSLLSKGGERFVTEENRRFMESYEKHNFHKCT